MITAIFFDFNAFLYFAYLFPLAEILQRKSIGSAYGKWRQRRELGGPKTFLIFMFCARNVAVYANGLQMD